MLTKTTETGIAALIYLALQKNPAPVSPRRIAVTLEVSPTYLAKISHMLVKAGILRSHRGALGGVSLGRAPEEITLLEIVAACQGQVLGSYCRDLEVLEGVCAFHRAMKEIHDLTVKILSRWTLAALIARPGPLSKEAEKTCKMRVVSRKLKIEAATPGSSK